MLEVLLQVPEGAMPVSGGRFTRTVSIDLAPFRTQAIDYYFYFPAAGEYQHYPVHVAKNGKLLANAEPFTLNVVEKLSKWIPKENAAIPPNSFGSGSPLYSEFEKSRKR